MTADELRRELDRIAESAPAAAVSGDLWKRARRSVLRDRLVAGAAALVVVVGIGGALAWLPDRTDVPVADAAAEGVPDHLYYVPEWVSDDKETDLAVGTGAAAWIEIQSRLPLVVGAGDGEYHVLDLPGYLGNEWINVMGLHEPTLALSPDGRFLAYSWAEFGPESDDEPIPSGVRLLDLATGEVESFALPGREGTFVELLTFSPDGAWLAWAGARMDSWTEASMGMGTGAVGRIHLAGSESGELVADRLLNTSLGVRNDGLVVLGDDRRVRSWDGESLTGASFASARERRIVADAEGRWAFPGPALITVTDGSDVRDIDVPIDGPAPEARPLGWVGDDVVVATYSNNGAGALSLVPADGGQPRQVAVVDTGTIRSLSVAVDLMTADRPTLARPEPDWGWSDERTLVVAVVAALGVVSLVAWLWARRRYRAAR